MRRAAALGAVAATCLALLLLVPALRRGVAGREAEGDTAGEERVELDPSSPGLERDAAPPASPPSPGATPDARRDSIAPTAAPGPTCLVRIVDAATKAPVPDARVWVQRADVDVGSAEWWRAIRLHNDIEPVLQGGFGDEHALDARGEVRVPRPERTLQLAAALGERHGQAELGPLDAECVVELERFQSLTVEVVDRAGRPVSGARVALFWGALDPLDGSIVLPTAENGRLRVARLEAQIWEKGYRGPLRVAVAGGVPCEPELVELSMADVPEEPLRFVAGAFGSVVVQLTDEQGRPLALDGRASVELDTGALAAPSLALLGGASLDAPVQAGRAVFPCVGLGLALEVGAGAEGHDYFWRSVDGPTAAGETVEVLVPRAERTWTARLRPSGIEACLGRRSAGIEGEWTAGWGGRFQGLAREGEVVELPIWGGRHAEGEPQAWRMQLFDPLGSPTATVVPERDVDEHVLDFGDVTFTLAPVLARFRVVDPDGRPAAHAILDLEVQRDLSCDAEGRCVLRSEYTLLPLRARAVHDAWLASDWAEVVETGAEATLVLRRGARLEGRLLLPPRVRAYDVTLAVGPRGEDHEVWVNPVEGGNFRFEACEPGVRDLVVDYEELRVLERTVELVAGETTVLPDIDLRVSMHPFELTFEIAGGEPWSDGHVEWREPESEVWSWARIGPDARLSLLATTPTIELWACGRGARPRRVEGVVDGDRLVLQPGLAVMLRLAPGIALPAPPLALRARLWEETPEDVEFELDADLDLAPARVRDDRTALVHLPRPGRYELGWFVQHEGTGLEFVIHTDEPQLLEVDDDGAVQTVQTDVTPEEVARAVLEAGG